MKIKFLDYINALRIHEACNILAVTKYSISDIALHVGFESIRTFNRRFMEIVGVKPSQYREQIKYIGVVGNGRVLVDRGGKNLQPPEIN